MPDIGGLESIRKASFLNQALEKLMVTRLKIEAGRRTAGFICSGYAMAYRT
jgi:hypothetical protein